MIEPNPVYARQSLITERTRPNSPNVFRLELPVRASELTRHIPHIVSASTEEQMRGVNAGRVVTPMQNAQPVWNRAAMNHPSHTRCVMPLPVAYIEPRATSALGKSFLPLPTSVSRAPDIARVKTRNQDWIARKFSHIVEVHSKPFHGFGCSGRVERVQRSPAYLFYA